jgi:hypothetical protein
VILLKIGALAGPDRSAGRIHSISARQPPRTSALLFLNALWCLPSTDIDIAAFNPFYLS